MAAHPDSTRTRNARRSAKARRQRAKLTREQRFAERLAEVPQSTLDAYSHYQLEMAKRSGRGIPLLRPIEEHRRRAGVLDE